MSEHCPKPVSMDDLHGDTPVAAIGITLYRSGLMRIDGSITDEVYARYLLDTARDTLKNYHIQQRKGLRSGIIIPAHDTALVGTPEEKKLLAARHELANAMAGK
jgi:hypothetical protein